MQAANVNPTTGLATDYLNLFNEATMIFEMAISMPEMAGELLNWKRRSYVEHFENSGFEKRDIVIAAYETMDGSRKNHFDNSSDQACDTYEKAISKILSFQLTDPCDQMMAQEMLAELKSVVARLDALIHGRPEEDLGDLSESGTSAEQATIDALF